MMVDGSSEPILKQSKVNYDGNTNNADVSLDPQVGIFVINNPAGGGGGRAQETDNAISAIHIGLWRNNNIKITLPNDVNDRLIDFT